MALNRQDLYSLEQYAEVRPAFREKVMAHKRERHIALGPNLSLYFEDKLTVQYQVQEMLRIERIFESSGIEDELAAYNPLIPDGRNWKATMMIEFPDVAERKQALARLVGVESKVWMQVAGHDKVFAIADEDLERSTGNKTSSVHFLRFELTETMAADVKRGMPISAGVDHPQYRESVTLSAEAANSLAADIK